MELGYWGIKGIVEPIRYLLAHLLLPYKEANPSDAEQWSIMKSELDLDFPNLPYLVDNDVRLTESDAIAMYLAIKADRLELFGRPGVDCARHRMLLDVLKDLRKSLFEVAMSTDGKKLFDARYEDVYVRKLGYLSRFLGDKQFLLGYLTYSDFYMLYDRSIMASVSKAVGRDDPTLLYSNLVEHTNSMKQVNGLKGYLERDIRNYFPFLIHRVDKLKIG